MSPEEKAFEIARNEAITNYVEHIAMNPTAAGVFNVTAAPPRRFSGAHEASFTIDGVEISVTYNEAGSDLPATETDPAEPPYKTLVSVVVGSQEVWGADADVWDDRFQLMAMVEEQRE